MKDAAATCHDVSPFTLCPCAGPLGHAEDHVCGHGTRRWAGRPPRDLTTGSFRLDLLSVSDGLPLVRYYQRLHDDATDPVLRAYCTEWIAALRRPPATSDRASISRRKAGLARGTTRDYTKNRKKSRQMELIAAMLDSMNAAKKGGHDPLRAYTDAAARNVKQEEPR